MMRRAVLFLMVITTMAVLAACGVTAEEFCPAGSGAVDAGAADAPSAVKEEEPPVTSVELELYREGRSSAYLLTEEKDRQIARDAVMDYMVKSAAWEDPDISTLDMYIRIILYYKDGTESEYYVYDRDGVHCMQRGRSGRYSVISDQAYRPLYELVMGLHTLHTMTIVSGGESVYAVCNRIWTNGTDAPGSNGPRMTPQEAAPLVEYITYAEDFAPYVDGELRPDLVFELYNEDFEEVKYFVPSGLSAWTFIDHAGPGKYIAVTEMSFEEDNGKSGYRYFFGLIIPEENA